MEQKGEAPAGRVASPLAGRAKRPWFQYHLSTAIVLMFVAAALLWLNIGLHEHGLYGWPFHVYSYDFTYFDAGLGGYQATPTTQNVAWLVTDIVIALLLLVAMMIACEERMPQPGRLRRAPCPAVIAVEICCLAACVGWNVSFPLSHYFRENLGGPLVARMLSWLFLTFSAVFICEKWLALSAAWKRGIIGALGLTCLIGMLIILLISPFLSQLRGSRSSPRRQMLQSLHIALEGYKELHGSYPPDASPTRTSGQTLYHYLCEPLPTIGMKFLRPTPECVHTGPGGVKELRGPLGHRYLYRLIPNAKTGKLEPVVEEIQARRLPAR